MVANVTVGPPCTKQHKENGLMPTLRIMVFCLVAFGHSWTFASPPSVNKEDFAEQQLEMPAARLGDRKDPPLGPVAFAFGRAFDQAGLLSDSQESEP